MTLQALPVVSRKAEKSFFQKKKKGCLPDGKQMLCNCIFIGQFTKLHIIGHNHYAKFPHCRIHVNGAEKWKINITKLYGHSFRRLPKCVMQLFVVTKVVMGVANVFKHLFCALHSVTVAAIVSDDYF